MFPKALADVMRGGEAPGVRAFLAQRLAAEALGTAFLLAAVVGSGVMAARLSGGNGALALLCNTLPTGAILAVLILTFGPISGAHFNPAVSIASALRGASSSKTTALYVAAQFAGGIAGVWAAHLMFELPLWQFSTTVRGGPGQWFAEAVATFGLLLTILGSSARTPAAVPYAVGLYITAAYWFTASTSFANPAVTVARALSDTYAGIAPGGVAGFIGAQLLGMLAAVALGQWFWPNGGDAPKSRGANHQETPSPCTQPSPGGAT
jgi:glycerol uptake facilitator-like aquaporin